jgi:hypothetical protein
MEITPPKNYKIMWDPRGRLLFKRVFLVFQFISTIGKKLMETQRCITCDSNINSSNLKTNKNYNFPYSRICPKEPRPSKGLDGVEFLFGPGNPKNSHR